MKQAMTADATIINDGFKAYRAIAAERSTLTMKFDPINNPDHMKWLHRAISNAKAFILGTYHGIKGKHLQAYLDEYCYRYNRRKFQGEWFNRLLNVSVSTNTLTFAELTALPREEYQEIQHHCRIAPIQILEPQTKLK